MKTYTEKELDVLIRAAVTETMNGVMEWIKNETDVVFKGTKIVLADVELTIKPNRTTLTKYVHESLKKVGIEFIPKNLAK